MRVMTEETSKMSRNIITFLKSSYMIKLSSISSSVHIIFNWRKSSDIETSLQNKLAMFNAVIKLNFTHSLNAFTDISE